MPRSFRRRGIVEGFYGPPWSHEARLDVLSFVGARGMNAYVYGPKDDPKHRARWRDPYDDVEMARFRELSAHARDCGIRFGFAISPGLDIDYESDADRAALRAKLAPFAALGVDWYLLLLDDIPSARGLAPRQAALTAWLLEELQREHADAQLAFCPTEYIGTRPSRYLSELGERLPPGVEVCWTGPTVCSPVVDAASAEAWASNVGGRPPLVWDNYPVNDASMEDSLHLGPYRGRDPRLADVTAGILCNPMRHAECSKVPLATAADFMLDPDAYDRDASWRRAIEAVGGSRAAALHAVADACGGGPLCAGDDVALRQHVDEVRDEIGGPGWIAAVATAAGALRAARNAPAQFTGDDHLSREVAPWAAAASNEAEAGLAALRLLQYIRPVGMLDDGVGRAVGVDAASAMQHAFIVLFLWAAARRNTHVVFGPRFAFYTAIVQMDDGKPALDVSGSLREDCNAIDALCRLALDEYEEWRTGAAGGVRVFVDGEARPVDGDGSFDPRGAMVLIRDGRCATRVRAGDRLPFKDARLT